VTGIRQIEGCAQTRIAKICNSKREEGAVNVAIKLKVTLKGAVVLVTWLAGMLAVASVALGQEGTAAKKGSEDVGAREKRVEEGLEPVDVGKGEPPLKLDLAAMMNAFNAPGMSVAVIDGYKIAWTKGYGVTEPGGKVPVTTRTLFQAGSISKPVATAAMLALVEQGKLSLDEDVNMKLKTWRVPENQFTKDQKVTLRRLASHTAGLTVHGFPGYDVDEKMPTLVQILNGEKPANTAAIRVDVEPGTLERYSGGGVTIEQQLMMDVTGKAFPALTKEMVLDKIGMSDSSYEQPLPAAWASRTAEGTYTSGKPVHGRSHIYPEMAAAGLWTTPSDLAKFAIEIALSKQGKSNNVISQKMTQEMLTPTKTADGKAGSFGIGFGVETKRPGEFGHNGADEGFQALLVMNADTGQGAAIMANSDNGILVAVEVLRSVAKEYAWEYRPEERSTAQQLLLVAKLKGTDAMLRKYDQLKNSSDPKKRPEEFVLNMLGYQSLQSGNTDEAIKLFARNVEEFPQSGNVYDSLGEAYTKAGKKELAIENYEKSLKLDTKNQNAVEWLKKLRGEK
jgi:CubicO group peptidase (beta-lactamase class C family)